MRFFGMLILVIASYGIKASDPEWIYSGVFEEYQDQRFITAVGEGISSADAGNQAYSRLGEQIKINISSQSDIVKKYQSTSNQVKQEENLDVRIQTQVDLENIEGIQIVVRYYKPETQTYYALATLNKQRTATKLSFKIEGQLERLRNQLVQVKNYLSNGRASEGISGLISMGQIFRDSINDIELHLLFARPASNSLLQHEIFNLIGEFDQYLGLVYSQIVLDVPGGLEKHGSPELGVSEPYRILFSFNGQSLKHIPVRVKADDEAVQIDADNDTDNQGGLSLRVNSLPYTGKQENKIEVGLDMDEGLFANRPPSVDLVVLLDQKSDISIRLNIRIRSQDHDYLQLIANDGLSSLLSTQNYHVQSEGGNSADKAHYILDLTGTVVKYPGFNGMQFSKISGVIQVRSGTTKRVLKTIKIDAEATKAGALTHADAAEKAIGLMIDVISEDLLSTLEKNLGRN